MKHLNLFENFHSISFKSEQNKSDYSLSAFVDNKKAGAIDYIFFHGENISRSFKGLYPFLNNPTKILYLDYLYVEEKYRKQNVGRNLVEKLIEIASSEDCDSVVLNVIQTNNTNDEHLVKIYEKFGFKLYDKINSSLMYLNLK